MLKSEVIDYTTKQKYTVSFFDDDTIETIRNQIAISMDSHPDRLFILVSLNLDNEYYQKDPRRWESLFDRMSYNGQMINQLVFQEYQLNYRSPNSTGTFQTFDRSTWMTKPLALQDIYSPVQNFSELRIFGVEEEKSYVLPFQFNGPLVSKIASARLPIPLQSTLVSTLYKPETIKQFVVIPYDNTADNVTSVYYPFFRSTTPSRLPLESINLIKKNAKLLNDLLEFKVFEPKQVNIGYVRLYAKFVDTDFGSAVRTRFEQIFYGLTVSEEVPYIGYFTSKSEVSRHKFYRKDASKKEPFIELSDWNRWYRKPVRNQPTLLLYRGTSKQNYDRVAITAGDITITINRDEDNTHKIEDMKKDVLKWLKTFDAVMSFVSESDIENERWETQDITFYAKYSRFLNEIDMRRFDCISSLFNRPSQNQAKFGLLRTDHLNYGISQVQVKIIQMMKDQIVKPQDIASELNVSVDDAKRLIQETEDMLSEDPNLGERAFRGYPTIELGTDKIKAISVDNIEKTLKYANILRFIVGFPDVVELDAICPKRVETVKVDTAIAPIETFQVDSVIEDEYADLFGYLEGEEPKQEEPKREEISIPKKERSIEPSQKQATKYGYFKQRLADFDPETFDPQVKGFQYAKECEQKRQPIILKAEDVEALSGTPYDPQTYLKPTEYENTQNPDGLIICPEYWCMRDEIPLTEDQLEREGDELACPLCGGKLRITEKEDPKKYTVVKRKEGFNYPGYVDYKSPKNGKPMPCCFKKAQKQKKPTIDDKYYIVREDILQLKDLRIAYLPDKLIQLLNIDESYKDFADNNRIQNGMSGFFRVGLGRPSETLSELLNLKLKISSPRDSVESVLKCSFLRTWKKLGENHIPAIDTALRKIEPYSKDEYTRENLAKIISGIDEAYSKKELSNLEELEYCSIFLNCDIFRIFTQNATLGCMFYSPLIRQRSRAIIILQNEKYIDILAYVTRLSRGFEYKSNIFDVPFKREVAINLEKIRNESCKLNVPSYTDALNSIQEILTVTAKDDFQVILDPYGRAQAFFIPNVIVLPFYPVALPNMAQVKLPGYNVIKPEELPTYEEVSRTLAIAKNYNNGYELAENLYNSSGKRVEVLLKSGLRIPIVADDITKPNETSEVIETVNTIGENKLVFSNYSDQLTRDYKNLSYASEIYEFLLFELTNDIQEDEQELRASLLDTVPNRKEVEPLLRKWFEKTVEYTKATEPINFLSKVRTPCGQFKSKNTCSGNLCAWNGKTCKVEVKNTVNKESLFNRLLTVLLENSKIRAMVLDGRTSPFFSTILYLELPTELILTDLDIININF